MKISKKILVKIEGEAKRYFVGASGCHDWSHVDRVRNLALAIGKKEKADLRVLEVACLLHDIGRKEEMDSNGKFCHAEKGAELAEKFLLKLKLDKEDIENIKHCIVSHRFRNEHIPKTTEAKVLFDADKLDSIGAVGIGRDFLFAGFIKNPMYTGREKEILKKGGDMSYSDDDSAVMEYEFKLKKVKNKILTKTGKKIAQERHNYTVDFFEKFDREIKGLE